MNIVEILELASEFYPCPPCYGRDVVIQFSSYYETPHSRKIFVYYYNAYILHVTEWLRTLCLITSINYGELIICTG